MLEKSSVSPEKILPLSHSSLREDPIVQHLSGKLLLKEELPPNLKEPYLSQLQRLDAIDQSKNSPVCNRCGNNKKYLFGLIPCSRCHQTHVYCRNCLQTGRVLACEKLYFWAGVQPKWINQSEPCTWNGNLTKAQQKAADRISEVMDSSDKKLLCWAVCGAGKTEMLFAGIALAISKNKRVCLATPRADVVRELFPRFRQAFKNTEIEALYGGTKEKTGISQLTIATTHQLIRYSNAFDVIIIDEIDAFPFHNDENLHYLANRALKTRGSQIFLTATPRKREQMLIQTGKLEATFVPVRFHGHPLPIPKEKYIFRLSYTLQKSNLPSVFKNWYQNRRKQTRQILLFLPTISLTTKLLPKIQAMFPDKKIESVHAEDEERKEKIDAYRNHEIDIILTTTILERGVTFPSVDVVVMDAGHAVFDEAALVQIAGRAGRSPDDPTGEVLFLHQGRTEALVSAIKQIKTMNRKGRNL